MKKVELLDIFSYSCMNCLRSFSFISALDKRYRKYGLKTKLIHPPEWKFEKTEKNVKRFLKENNINLPIVIDKNKALIKKLKINFWPAQVLKINNKIVYLHIGEGNYKQLENAIQKALNIRKKKLFQKEPKYSKLPTLYLGTRKGSRIRPYKKEIQFGKIYGKGWIQKEEYAANNKENELQFIAKGKIIYIVAEAKNNSKIEVITKYRKKTTTIKQPRLYKLIDFKENRKRIIDIKASNKIKIYSIALQ